MNYLSDQDLLSIWEFGTKHSVIETNLFLLTYAYPNFDINQIASFSIGERDVRLLHIRQKLFGSVLHNTSNCTACGQKTEWEMTTESLELQAIELQPKVKVIELNYKKNQLQFRLLNSQDTLEFMVHDTPDINKAIQKCIIQSTLPASLIKDIPEDLKEMVIQKMEEIDPQANIVMNLSCPECKEHWTATFDIMQYLWSEINDWAVQLIQDIYLLATNFGWSESNILEMSRFRRNLYINMINQ